MLLLTGLRYGERRLHQPVTRIGPGPGADVFTQLCDVDAAGRSTNVCDGLAQLRTSGEEPALSPSR